MTTPNDFKELFDQWAPIYDQTVYDADGEYNEVFEDYDEILANIVQHIPNGAQKVLEFGVGTGNLSQKLIEHGYDVIGVEPSDQMRQTVQRKPINIDLREGNFLEIPLSNKEQVDVIVSSYAFHHLTLTEKQESIRLMKAYLKENGAFVFADTAYEDKDSKQNILDRVHQQGKTNLLHDLQTEYYEVVEELKHVFENEGLKVRLKQLNRFVWLIVAK